METLSLIEHSLGPIVETRLKGEMALSNEDAALLGKLENRLPARTFSWGHRSVKFAHFCGVISLGNLTLEILPKIYGKEKEAGACRQALVRMLVEAKRLPRLKGGRAAIGLQKHTLLDLFILHFCDQLHGELMQGMIRFYVEKEENLNVLRGRLKTELQFKHNLAHRERLYCQYDELSCDNLHNRIIKSVLKLMKGVAAGVEARKGLTELLMRFAGIGDILVDLQLFEKLLFDRSTSRYKAIFTQCRWFVQGLHPDVVAGQNRCISVLFDMNRLFEAYVAKKMRPIARKTGMQMREQGPQRHMARRADTEEQLFLMKPDMVFMGPENIPVAIADAKWKLLDEKEKRLGISQADLYQMNAYATRYKVDKLALIYPYQQRLTKTVTFRLQETPITITIIPIDVTIKGEVPISFLDC
jgi:5-methylcytosine-specific restriction enzyme subunit McrC